MTEQKEDDFFKPKPDKRKKDDPRSLSLVARSQAEKQWEIGRAPWYDTQTQRVKRPLFIAVGGGTASGKTTVCDEVVRRLGVPWVALVSMDCFYRPLTQEERANVSNYNFDHPDAFDWPLFLSVIDDLSQSKSVKVPRYNFATHSREAETDTVYGADVCVFEGILVLHDPRVRAKMDICVYVDEESDIRLARRLKRDIVERGRTAENVLRQYLKTVRPSFEQFCLPTKQHADLIIPRGGDNYVAIDLLVEHIRTELRKRGKESTHTKQKFSYESLSIVPNQLPKNVRVMERTPGLVAIHTELRDRNTDSYDFAFVVTRLCRLILTDALTFFYEQSHQSHSSASQAKTVTENSTDVLASASFSASTSPSSTATTPRKSTPATSSLFIPPPLVAIQTPTDSTFIAQQPLSNISAVCVVRGGETMEDALKQVLVDAPVGKIVIQQKHFGKQHGPRLYYCKLPANIAQHRVLLLDSCLATGNALVMALRVLLEHHVPLNRICVCVMMATPTGIQTILQQFPSVSICVSMIDEGLDENGDCSPGMGCCAHRFFNTSE